MREIKDTYNRDYTEFEKDWIDFINVVQKMGEMMNKKLNKTGGYIISSSQLCPEQGILSFVAVNKNQINKAEMREKK